MLPSGETLIDLFAQKANSVQRDNPACSGLNERVLRGWTIELVER